jgi:hypothetical protein
VSLLAIYFFGALTCRLARDGGSFGENFGEGGLQPTYLLHVLKLV